MEISVLILSCVILGLNPVLPVLLYFLISRFVTLYGFYQIKYIHTYSSVKNSSADQRKGDILVQYNGNTLSLRFCIKKTIFMRHQCQCDAHTVGVGV